MRTGNGMNFGRIAAVAPGMTYEYVATATNGWNAVVIGSKVGWVSGKYYAEGTHPAIISPETFAQACALRERNRQAKNCCTTAPSIWPPISPASLPAVWARPRKKRF